MNDNVKQRASVCCLVGIPGSGKSTIARATIEQCRQFRCGAQKSSSSSPGYASDSSYFDEMLLIDYDDLTTKELISNCCPSFDSDGGLEAWRKSRVVAKEKLKNALSNHFSCDIGDMSSLLIILDDNFHLRSMRREIYRSCQDIIQSYPQAQIGFAVVYCSAPLEVCLRRNDLRSGKARISRDVIDRMTMSLEPPDESKPYASFERFHVTIDTAKDIAVMSEDGEQIISTVHRCLEESLQSPVMPTNELTREEVTEIEQKRMHDRENTLKSSFQRFDQLLRKLVGAVGRIEKEKSKEANEARKLILSKMRLRNDVDSIGDDFIVQQFACAILSPELDWREMDNPLATAINDVARTFRRETEK